jgi:hypothetical protein
MIKEIIALLPVAKGETENIKIAQGKFKMPETFMEGYHQIKTQIKWKK